MVHTCRFGHPVDLIHLFRKEPIYEKITAYYLENTKNTMFLQCI